MERVVPPEQEEVLDRTQFFQPLPQLEVAVVVEHRATLLALMVVLAVVVMVEHQQVALEPQMKDETAEAVEVVMVVEVVEEVPLV